MVRLAAVLHTSADSEGYLSIADHVSRKILPFVGERDCPPLQVIIYAARNILFPSLLRSEIMDLLRLIAHAECVRQSIIHSEHGWNSHRQGERRTGSPRDTSTATSELDQAALDGEIRALYREIITGFALVVSYVSQSQEQHLIHAIPRMCTRHGSRHTVTESKS